MKKYALILVLVISAIGNFVALCQRDVARNERDVLSDAIRNHVDNGDTTLMDDVEYYLNVINKDTNRLSNWVYCY